jgi:hypothetical protein
MVTGPTFTFTAPRKYDFLVLEQLAPGQAIMLPARGRSGISTLIDRGLQFKLFFNLERHRQAPEGNANFEFRKSSLRISPTKSRTARST